MTKPIVRLKQPTYFFGDGLIPFVIINSENRSSNMNSISEICIRLLSLVPLFTMVPIVIATADPGGMASSSPPLTMARFYVINNEGRSVPDEDTPTQKEQQNQQPLELPLKKSNGRQRDLPRKGREHADNRLPMPDNRDMSKAWKCEQHGFFFTTDGRCILPIINVTKSSSGALGRRPIRRNSPSQ